MTGNVLSAYYPSARTHPYQSRAWRSLNQSDMKDLVPKNLLLARFLFVLVDVLLGMISIPHFLMSCAFLYYVDVTR
ncbi:hypothetical protein K439DRAFT_280059 [Ramaria rubella]|nr:hypothetical protein K439DRAFT_280059 [Ramaria rubella]